MESWHKVSKLKQIILSILNEKVSSMSMEDKELLSGLLSRKIEQIFTLSIKE